MRAIPFYRYIGETHPQAYEWENRVADPDRRLEAFMESIAPLRGARIADLGAGAGYHACLYAPGAAHVFAIEPSWRMLRLIHRRVARDAPGGVSVIIGGAEEIPLRDGLLDVVHARFAYFFGPGRPGGTFSCEPGIQEAIRVLKDGGVFFVIDNDLRSGEFAGFLDRYGYPEGHGHELQEATDEFWTARGFEATTVESSWTAPDRAKLRLALSLSFRGKALSAIMSEVSGSSFSYHYRVYWRRK